VVETFDVRGVGRNEEAVEQMIDQRRNPSSSQVRTQIRHSPGNSQPMPDRFAHYASASALRMHARIPSSRGVT